MAKIDIYEDPIALAGAVAQKTAETLKAALANDTAVWVLAGGTTPMAAYKLLVGHYKASLDWTRVTVLMGDERIVPLTHELSSWGAVTPFLDELGIPDENRIVPPTELGAAAAAEAYEQVLRQLPRLDLVWLGVGEDGHTLSLFPGRDTQQLSLAMPVFDSPKPPAQRMTLTYTALEHAKNCFIIAAGAGKSLPITRALKGNFELPVAKAVQTVEHAGGEVTWLLDAAAATNTKQ